MKILYPSCHATLEYDEVSLFSEMGIDVFSWGAYRNPSGHVTLPRPGIQKLNYYPDFEQLSGLSAKTNVPQVLIDWADCIFLMAGTGDVEILTENWPRIKHKKVVWRTIGQSYPWQERAMKPMKKEGLKIVRYSPKEKNLPDYLGQDDLIRFYKPKDEFKDWNGGNLQVINFTQSLKGRGKHCFYDDIVKVMSGFSAKVFGPGNDNLGNLNGGETTYEGLKAQLRDARVYFYTGTWPASYSLSFIEAFMTGTPLVCISKRWFKDKFRSEMDVDLYEIPDFISQGETGFIADTTEEARSYIQMLLTNGDLAAKISEKARRKAIELFDITKVQPLWKDFFEKI